MRTLVVPAADDGGAGSWGAGGAAGHDGARGRAECSGSGEGGRAGNPIAPRPASFGSDWGVYG
jgi:hypothetical protein